MDRYERAFRFAGIATALLSIVSGCQSTPISPGREAVSTHLSERTDQYLSAQSGPEAITLPPGASLEHSITEDEAISIALWNNAAFQELLADLGIARGDLIQAGLLPNPEFLYYWGVTDKPFKYLFDFPIECIWLRPIRICSASHEANRTSQRLTQAGLDLIRDVRQAYADVVLARERLRIAGQAVELRGRIAELAAIRFKAGDISEQESATARIDALTAVQDATRMAYDVPVFEERLRNLMGIGPVRAPLNLEPSSPPMHTNLDVDELTQSAMTTRPDSLAAAEAVAAAEARLKFARIGWVRMLGLMDATSGVNGHEFGPALRFTVPIFNRNQGGIARAEAEYEKAARNQKTVAYQIILDVQRSYLQYTQTQAELEVLRSKVRPEVEAAIKRSQLAYQEGNVAIFIVLETTRLLLDNYVRDAVLQADLRRFWAELERSVGHKIGATAKPVTDQKIDKPKSS